MIKLDGWITIGTKLSTDKFDQQISDLENKIDSEEKKQELLNNKTQEYQKELSAATDKVKELTEEFNNATQKAEDLQNIIKNTKPGSYQNYMATAEFEEQSKIVEELYQKLSKAESKQAGVQNKVTQTNIQYENSVKAVDRLRGKVEQINMKRQNEEFKQVKNTTGKIIGNIEDAIGKIGKMALAVFGVRSAYSMLRRASSTLAGYNEQYARDLEYIKFSIANGLAPILEKIVSLAQTLMAIINHLSMAWFGKQIFASAKDFEKMSKSASGISKSTKETKNNLASFDEINVLSSNKGESGGGVDTIAPSIDFGSEEIGTKFEEFKQMILENFSGLIEDLSVIGEEFYETFLNPFMDTLRESILPVLEGLSTEIILTVSTLVGTITSLLSGLWYNVIKPIVDLIMLIWDGAWKSIKGAWDTWGNPIFENLRTAIVKVQELIEILWASFLQPIFDNLIKNVTELWDQHLQPLWDNLLDFFGEIINGALEIWNETLQPILAWIIQTFGPEIANVINFISNLVSSAIGIIIDVINSVITVLKGLVQFIVGVFTGDWEKAWRGLQNIVSGIWDGIEVIIKGSINLIIDFINGMIAAIEKALNWVVDKINKLEITNPFTGDEIWSPNVERFDFGRIPKLAKGGIIAKPTQAIIGESGKEAVVPLENNTEWMDALAEKISESVGGSQQEIVIRFEGSMSQFVKELMPEIEMENKRVGTRIIAGGAY